MKKLLLALIVVGGLLTLPGCWCCRKACDEPCVEYIDDCYDRCEDVGHDHDQETYWEEQGGYRVKKSRRSVEGMERRPNRVWLKGVNQPVIDQAHAEGKECKFLNPDHANLNAKIGRERGELEVTQVQSSKRSRRNGNNMPNAEMEVMEEETVVNLK